jgi:hypothetical protein
MDSFEEDEIEVNVVIEEERTETKIIYSLPDDVMILQKIKGTIKQFPGHITVQIGSMDVQLSQE